MPELQSEFAAQDAPSGLLDAALRVQTPVLASQMPELQSLLAAQDAPSDLPAAPLRVHSPVATLQLPELQSVFVAQAAPSGACADAVPIFATPAAAMAAAAISFVIMAANDGAHWLAASLDLRSSDVLAQSMGEC
jgi:hypothetical protein